MLVNLSIIFLYQLPMGISLMTLIGISRAIPLWRHPGYTAISEIPIKPTLSLLSQWDTLTMLTSSFRLTIRLYLTAPIPLLLTIKGQLLQCLKPTYYLTLELIIPQIE